MRPRLRLIAVLSRASLKWSALALKPGVIARRPSCAESCDGWGMSVLLNPGLDPSGEVACADEMEKAASIATTTTGANWRNMIALSSSVVKNMRKIWTSYFYYTSQGLHKNTKGGHCWPPS